MLNQEWVPTARTILQAGLLIICVLIGSTGSTTFVYQIDEVAIDAAISASARPDTDRRIDQRRKPKEVLSLLDVKPGMRVLDVFAGSGYYTELLSRLVGPTGEVIYQSNDYYARSLRVALNRRFRENRLPNVTQKITKLNELEFAPREFDRVLLALTYHDYYFEDRRGMRIDPPAFLSRLREGLKDDGIVVIVDHNAALGRGIEDAARLHRIEKSFAIKDFQTAGFTLLHSSDVLMNKEDDHTLSVFDPAIRGNTDRFVLAFKKASQG